MKIFFIFLVLFGMTACEIDIFPDLDIDTARFVRSLLLVLLGVAVDNWAVAGTGALLYVYCVVQAMQKGEDEVTQEETEEEYSEVSSLRKAD